MAILPSRMYEGAARICERPEVVNGDVQQGSATVVVVCAPVVTSVAVTTALVGFPTEVHDVVGFWWLSW